jgi:hypothetical protein
MFNPAWLFYGLFALLILAALATVARPNKPSLPDVSQLGTERRANTVDEYSILVARYGEPNSIIAADTEPPASVPVRTAEYSSGHVNVVFVPNGCVAAYDKFTQSVSDLKKYPELAKRQMKSIAPCVPSPSGWTIVGYINSGENWTISADHAVQLLDSITAKRTSPPIVKIESRAKNSKSRRLSKLQPAIEIHSDPQVVALEKERIQSVQDAATRSLYTMLAVLLTGIGVFAAGIVVHKKNRDKRITRLFYELNDVEQAKYSIVHGALMNLSKSHVIWRVNAQSATSDWKRNAGASSLVRRSQIYIEYMAPRRVQTNISVLCLNLGHIQLFFLPDVILYCERGVFGSIAYQDFRVEQSSTRFIEDGYVPGDGTVVDRTWRFVNKKGGPDRRFNNNVQLPVLQYGVLVLQSSRGLNIHLNTSNLQLAQVFANAWRELYRIGQSVGPRMTPSNGGEVDAGPEALALKTLGLAADAQSDEISAAYRRLAQMYHPDKVAGLAPEFQVLADKRMKEINAAYEILKERRQTEVPAQQTSAAGTPVNERNEPNLQNVFAGESETARTLVQERGRFWEYLLTEELLRSRLSAVQVQYDSFDEMACQCRKRP